MVEAVRRAFAREPLVVGPKMRSGMAILYETPREVGADRIVNAVAAYEQVKGGVIVVDFGTATTFDCVTQKGEYLGGVIAPGIQISADALFARAAKLHPVEIAKPARVVGRNPVQSMQSGIVYGYAGPGRRRRRAHQGRARVPVRRHRHRRPGKSHRSANRVDRASRRRSHVDRAAPAL